ncbi:MAG: glycosyltransferase family A protein [Verrucomicrobiota bacterium]
MFISVIIPLYNKSRFVERAVKSVQAQSYSDFELLIVDDGSTDDSAEIAMRHSDLRMRLIRQDNAGVSAARNRGITEAKGNLVAFLDADDEWNPTFLETTLALRMRFPQASIWATGYCHSSSGKISRNRFHLLHEGSDPQGFLLDYFAENGAWMGLTCSCMLIRKEALQTAGGFPIGVVRGEDHDTWVRMALRYPIAWTPRCLVTHFDDDPNNTDHYSYTGNWPYFDSVREYLTEVGSAAGIPDSVYQWLAKQHTGRLRENLLSNNRLAIREIIRDCRQIPGYRLKCLLWSLILHIPHHLITVAWRLKSLLAGRGGRIASSRFRGIRPFDRSRETH